MKQELDNDSIEALVTYRIQRAREALLEAKTLLKSDFFNAAINRFVCKVRAQLQVAP
jgi:uncharacterized protein